MKKEWVFNLPFGWNIQIIYAPKTEYWTPSGKKSFYLGPYFIMIWRV